jgi:hypothetical protein
LAGQPRQATERLTEQQLFTLDFVFRREVPLTGSYIEDRRHSSVFFDPLLELHPAVNRASVRRLRGARGDFRGARHTRRTQGPDKSQQIEGSLEVRQSALRKRVHFGCMCDELAKKLPHSWQTTYPFALTSIQAEKKDINSVRPSPIYPC